MKATVLRIYEVDVADDSANPWTEAPKILAQAEQEKTAHRFFIKEKVILADVKTIELAADKMEVKK